MQKRTDSAMMFCNIICDYIQLTSSRKVKMKISILTSRWNWYLSQIVFSCCLCPGVPLSGVNFTPAFLRSFSAKPYYLHSSPCFARKHVASFSSDRKIYYCHVLELVPSISQDPQFLWQKTWETVYSARRKVFAVVEHCTRLNSKNRYVL